MADREAAQFVDRIAAIPGIMRCSAKDDSTLDVWAEYVKEAGCLLRVTIDGESVYCKDAPALIFSRIGYTVAKGENTCWASYRLTGKLDELDYYDADYGCCDEYGVEVVNEYDSAIDRTRLSGLVEERARLLKNYLTDDQATLDPLLRNLDGSWDVKCYPWQPTQSHQKALIAFLNTYPATARHWLNWYAQRPFGFGAPHVFCWNGSGEWFWVDGGTAALKPRKWMGDVAAEHRPPVYRICFRAGSERQVEVSEDDPHKILARLLVAGDESGIRCLAIDSWRALFPDECSEPVLTEKAGSYCGVRAKWSSPARRLRQIGADRAAELLLLKIADAIEEEASQTGEDVTSWHYEQLRIIYKKRADYQSEVDIIKRHIEWRSKSRDKWGPEFSAMRAESIEMEQEELAKAMARLEAFGPFNCRRPVLRSKGSRCL